MELTALPLTYSSQEMPLIDPVCSGDSVQRFNGTSGEFINNYIDKKVSYASGLAFSADNSKIFVTGPYAGNLIATFKAQDNDTVAHFDTLFRDQYMRNCQGLVRYNQTLFAACR